MAQPKTCAIIVNFNHSHLTLEAIASLEKACDVVVVDNSTEAEARDVIARAEAKGGFTLLQNSANLGYARAVNIGLQYALNHNYQYLFVLNPDTTCSAAMIHQLEKRCEEDHRIEAISPIILYPNGTVWFAGTTINLYFGRAEHRYHQAAPSSVKETEPFISPTLSGCAIFVRREIVEKAGLMPEEYFLYYEDADWTFRMSRLGIKLYVDPKATMTHQVSASGTAGRVQQYYMYRNRIIFVRKYGNFAERCFIWIGSVLDMFYTIKPISMHRLKLFVTALQGELAAARGDSGKAP